MVVLSLFQIREVILMAVGFLLEADVLVGRHPVAILQEKDEPLDAVPDEEWQVEQLPLLGSVDEFVVEFCLVERSDGKDETKQTDGQEVFAQQYLLD